MLSGRKVIPVQFDLSSFTWRSPQYSVRHFGRTRIQVDTRRVSQPSPFQLFRRRRILSVSDLVSPAWCEVQFDYGLRGKRSGPIASRPKSIVSSAGKKISIQKFVAERNEVKRDQGRAVHKKLELQVEVRKEVHKKEVHKKLELEVQKVKPKVEPKAKVVEISSKDGMRFALRFVNMLACLRCILVDGYTREMPVFGIIHGVVLLGTVDEIMVESREKVLESPDRSEGTEAEEVTSSTSGVNPPAMLYLKDNKTRQHPSVPPHHDTFSGRMQLMLYRRLLSQLVAKSPLYDFNPLWKRLGVDSSSLLPKKSLVEAKLIPDNTDVQLITLDDVVSSWHELVRGANVQGVSENLELVYRLRIPPDRIQKSKAISSPEVDNCDTASTPKDIPTPQIVTPENSTTCPSNHTEGSATVTEGSGEEARPLADQEGVFSGAIKPSLKRSRKKLRKPKGILKIIGRKGFLHDDIKLDAYLAHILKWWRGERKPVGVPLTGKHASRCFSCEYLDDCEWRIGIRNSLELIHQLNKSDSDVSVSDQDPKMKVPNPDGSSEILSST